MLVGVRQPDRATPPKAASSTPSASPRLSAANQDRLDDLRRHHCTRQKVGPFDLRLKKLGCHGQAAIFSLLARRRWSLSPSGRLFTDAARRRGSCPDSHTTGIRIAIGRSAFAHRVRHIGEPGRNCPKPPSQDEGPRGAGGSDASTDARPPLAWYRYVEPCTPCPGDNRGCRPVGASPMPRRRPEHARPTSGHSKLRMTGLGHDPSRSEGRVSREQQSAVAAPSTRGMRHNRTSRVAVPVVRAGRTNLSRTRLAIAQTAPARGEALTPMTCRAEVDVH